MEDLEIYGEGSTCGWYFSYIPWQLYSAEDWVAGYDGWGEDYYTGQYWGWITYSVYDESWAWSGAVSSQAQLQVPPPAAEGRLDLAPGEHATLTLNPKPALEDISSFTVSNGTLGDYDEENGTIEFIAASYSGPATVRIVYYSGNEDLVTYQIRPPTAVSMIDGGSGGHMAVRGVISGGFQGKYVIGSSYAVNYAWLAMNEGSSSLFPGTGGLGPLHEIGSHPDYGPSSGQYRWFSVEATAFVGGHQPATGWDTARAATRYRLTSYTGTDDYPGPGTSQNWTGNGGDPTGSGYWVIPLYYRITDTGAPDHLFAYVTQQFDVNNAGAMTVSKAGASHEQSYAPNFTWWPPIN